MRSPAEILKVREHRPWELPTGPWIMMQQWRDLLFAHWPISTESIRPLVPEILRLQTFDSSAWISITPFALSLRPRGLPTLLRFPELNCRTYVQFGDKPGIFFFSLDAGSRLAVWGARATYLLPYFYATMSCRSDTSGIQYHSSRTNSLASFTAQYTARGGIRHAKPGSLEHFLSERYCLYSFRRGALYRAEIHHEPWPLQDATCEIQKNTVATAAGIDLPETAPLLQFARKLDVLIWRLKLA